MTIAKNVLMKGQKKTKDAQTNVKIKIIKKV
jgi:hypothetical protein